MNTFADNWVYQGYLSISKEHLDAIDQSRIIEGKFIGIDNVNKLRVSTVFACIAVEAALNDYLTSHYLFLDNNYLEAFFAEWKPQVLRSDVVKKIEIVSNFCRGKFPEAVIADVKLMFRIRNRIIHQTPEFKLRKDSLDGKSTMTLPRMDSAEITHMRRHHEIAFQYLSLVSTPGTRELKQWELAADSEPPEMEQ